MSAEVLVEYLHETSQRYLALWVLIPERQLGWKLFFFFFLAAPWHMEFLGQGSDQATAATVDP